MASLSRQKLTAGIDEAGRGCLAGPVVAAAVILPFFFVPGLADSKKISSGKRNLVAADIKKMALAWSVGITWHGEIDRINILQATLKAMVKAVSRLKIKPDHILIDGNQKIPLNISQQTIVGGDGSEPCISAASILAKTFRDRLMISLDHKYPGYGFAGHKGYGTREHLMRIRRLGPSPIHRMTFSGVRPVRREKTLCLPLR
jgi:ribonuclease HII